MSCIPNDAKASAISIASIPAKVCRQIHTAYCQLIEAETLQQADHLVKMIL
jgi:ribonuclease HII